MTIKKSSGLRLPQFLIPGAPISFALFRFSFLFNCRLAKVCPYGMIRVSAFEQVLPSA